MNKKHSRYSPSSATVWLNCQKSLDFDKIEAKSAVADEGTLAHNVCEHLLRKKDPPVCDEEMMSHCESYVDFVEKRAENSDHFLIEKTARFDNIVRGGFGTADCIIVKNKTLTVIDFKYGFKKIDAEENKQLLLYAVGACNIFQDIENIELLVFQPRIKNISSWLTNKKYLDYFSKKSRKKMSDYFKGDSNFNPSYESCAYCHVNKKCEAVYKNLYNFLGEIKMKIENKILTDKEKIDFIKQFDFIKKIKEEYEKELIFRLENNEEIEGVFLTKTRPIREWDDSAEDVLTNKIGDRAYNKKLITITQAKKLFDVQIDFDEITKIKEQSNKLGFIKGKENKNG